MLALAHPAWTWDALPALPRPISGQCVGVSNGALLVIGGSYFPKPLFEGGKKTWVDTIHVFERNAWKTFQARRAVGYGACVTTRDGVVVAGGGDAEGNFRDVYRVVWQNGEIRTSSLPALPEPLANAAAAVLGNTMYVAGGQSSPTAAASSKALWALRLDDPQAGWKRLADCPGAGRILPVFGVLDDALYLASGAELSAAADGTPKRAYLRDAWSYTPGHGWKPLPEVPRAMVAAPVVSRRQAIYVFGGDDGANADRIQELKDAHPGFSRQILEWKPRRGTWTKAGPYPAGLVTTMAAEWSGRIVIAGGEDRPGHRCDTVVTMPAERLP